MDNPVSPTPIPPKPPISLNLAFLIITLVSLLLSIFFIYQNWRLNQKLEALIRSQPTPTPSVANPPLTETPPIDPTANWKTYRNETAGYSLKYPADMLVFCNYPNTKGLRLWQAPFDCPNGHDIFYEIAVIENLPGEYKEYKKPSSARQINIDGIKATEKTYVYENTDGPLQSLGQSTEILIDNNGYTIQIQLLGNSLDKKNLFDQILSTFKFLDNTNEGTLKATVMRSPTCAGPQRLGDVCEAPVANETFNITKLSDNRIIQSVRTDKDGKFIVSLAFGIYQLQSLSSGIGKNIGNPDFTITAGKTITQQFDIDTGIR